MVNKIQFQKIVQFSFYLYLYSGVKDLSQSMPIDNSISLYYNKPSLYLASNMNRKLMYQLKQYYSNWPIRVVISIIYVINQLLLAIYLLFIPLQIAYYWLLEKAYNGSLQISIDIAVLIFFLIHIFLYFDNKLYEWLKSPYTNWYKNFITIELAYDIICVGLAIFAVVVANQGISQRAVQIVYFFKIYKLIEFDIKCMHIVVGTWFSTPYKILRTLLVVFMAISYIASFFYGIAYYLYTQNIEYSYLLWIVDTGAITDCVDQPLIIQIQYAIYWALGTASTAAYGDISAAEPYLVLYNIFALAFEGFLFGYYLNTMHSIPMQSKQQQADLLQKFDAFQQHCSNRKMSKGLYLQILCSLQYTQSQKRKLDSIEKLMPRKYMQQIRANIYYNFVNDPTFFGNAQFQLQIAEKIQTVVCQMGQDVYEYRNINKDDLLYVKQGRINCYFKSEIKFISSQITQEGECFGVFGFLTGLLVKQRALCQNYCALYKLARKDYKELLPQILKLKFNELQLKAFSYQGFHLQRQPIIKVLYNLEHNNSNYPFTSLHEKQNIILKRYNQQQRTRAKLKRQNIKSMTIKKWGRKTKNVQIQTEQENKHQFQTIYMWNKGKQMKNTYHLL